MNEAEENNNIQFIIDKYESMLANPSNRSLYFDADEMDIIIDYYFFLPDLEKADKAIEFAHFLLPNNNDIVLKRGKLLYIENKLQEAVSFFANQSIVDGDYVAMWGECLLKIGKLEQSVDKFRAYLLQCEVEELLDIYLDIVSIYTSEGQFEIALYWLNEANAVFPNELSVINEYAYHYYTTEDYLTSIEYCQKSIDMNPYQMEIWLHLGTIYFKMNNMVESLDAYNFAQTLDPTNLIITIQRAHCLFNLGEYESAKQEYKTYLEENSYDPIAWCFYAECFENTEDYTHAIEYYTKTLSLEEDNVDALLGLSSCYKETDQSVDKAFDYANKAYKLQPENIEAIINLAEIVLDMAFASNEDDLFETALNLFLRAHRSVPHDDSVNAHIGMIYFKHGMFRESLPYFEKAYNENSNSHNILIHLSLNYYALNDYQKWIIFFDKAKEMHPNTEEIFTSIFPEWRKMINQ